MNLQEFVKYARSTDPKIIINKLKDNFYLMESESDVMAMTDLIVYICGEQSGEWEKGIDLLKKIKNNAKISDKTHIHRAVGILSLGNNPNISIDHFSLPEQIIIYTQTATAIAKLGGHKNAEKFLKLAEEIKLNL